MPPKMLFGEDMRAISAKTWSRK